MALALATYAENESLFDFHESFLQGSIKKLEQKLQKQIIGQDNALKILLENIHVHEMLFSGPGGTGKQKTAQILAHELFGAASFRYVDLLQLQKYPLKMRWQEHVIKEIASLQIGVIFLDNFKDDDLDQKIIINFVKEFCRINEMTIKIIYAAHQILDKDDFSGLHIQFEKLTTKDLEMIILLQIEKIKTIRDIGQIDTFALSIRAHNELSIYTIKKVLEGYLS